MVRRARKAFSKAQQRARREGTLEPRQADYTQVFAITMADIDKALTKLDTKDPTAEDTKVDAKLPKDLEDLREHFLNNKGTFLALHCPGQDHAIDLLKDEQG